MNAAVPYHHKHLHTFPFSTEISDDLVWCSTRKDFYPSNEISYTERLPKMKKTGFFTVATSQSSIAFLTMNAWCWTTADESSLESWWQTLFANFSESQFWKQYSRASQTSSATILQDSCVNCILNLAELCRENVYRTCESRYQFQLNAIHAHLTHCVVSIPVGDLGYLFMHSPRRTCMPCTMSDVYVQTFCFWPKLWYNHVVD